MCKTRERKKTVNGDNKFTLVAKSHCCTPCAGSTTVCNKTWTTPRSCQMHSGRAALRLVHHAPARRVPTSGPPPTRLRKKVLATMERRNGTIANRIIINVYEGTYQLHRFCRRRHARTFDRTRPAVIDLTRKNVIFVFPSTKYIRDLVTRPTAYAQRTRGHRYSMGNAEYARGSTCR